MRSLSWKLWGALLLVVLISVGLMAFLTNLTTTIQFREYISQGNAMYTSKLADTLGEYYNTQKSWSGVQTVITSALRATNERIILADSSGRVIADTEQEIIGTTAASAGLESGLSITTGTSNVGTMWVLTTSGVNGTGMGRRGLGGMVNAAPTTTVIADPEGSFTNKITVAVLVSGLVSVVFALLIGWLLTRQITKPVLSLNYGAQQIARGKLDYRVKIKSHDEIGTLADSFNTMAANLENSEVERRRMIADIAHELRTPLTVIDGTVNAIIDGVFQPDKERLDSIKEQTQTLTRLIADIRELSLADSGQLKLEMRPTDLNDLLTRKLDQLRIKAGDKGVELTFSAAPLPEILLDPTRIEQVISNLIMNAIRHTAAGGRITVTAESSGGEKHQNSVLLKVNDTGEGIPEEHLAHIFDRFYRVEPSRSRNEGGAGLGLAIVKQLVEAHGGRVWAESRPGQGSTFFVTLPATGSLT